MPRSAITASKRSVARRAASDRSSASRVSIRHRCVDAPNGSISVQRSAIASRAEAERTAGPFDQTDHGLVVTEAGEVEPFVVEPVGERSAMQSTAATISMGSVAPARERKAHRSTSTPSSHTESASVASHGAPSSVAARNR